MQPLLLLLVFAAAGSCNAGLISIRSQGLPQGGTLYVLGGQADSQPVLTGMLSRIQLAPMTVHAQAGSATQAFSSVFTDRRSSLFDSAISTWMDQQLAALDLLQSMVDTSSSARMPCPRAAAATAASQANMPDVLAYMASSRFGPAMHSTFAQQSMAAPEEYTEDAEDSVLYDGAHFDDDELVGDAELAAELAGDPDLAAELGFDVGMSDYTAATLADGYASEQPDMPAESVDGFSVAGRGFYPSMLAEDDGVIGDNRASLAPGQIINKDDGPTWFFVLDDGSVNWGLVLFVLLAAAVLGVWFHICRSAARLFQAHRAQRLESAQFLSSAQAPLLAEWRGVVAPLAPEKPVAQSAAPDLFTAIEVASEQAPTGSFFAPKGNEYVTIAYVPLKGEQ